MGNNIFEKASDGLGVWNEDTRSWRLASPEEDLSHKWTMWCGEKFYGKPPHVWRYNSKDVWYESGTLMERAAQCAVTANNTVQCKIPPAKERLEALPATVGFIVPEHLVDKLGIRGGVKGDSGKAPVGQAFTAYFPRAMQAVADVSAYGAKKYNLSYADKNFLKVDGAIGRYTDAMDRHRCGESIDKDGIDPESGKLHAAMVAWNAMARLELMLIEKEKKDV